MQTSSFWQEILNSKYLEYSILRQYSNFQPNLDAMQFDIEKQTHLCGKSLSVGHSSSGSVNDLLDIVPRAVLHKLPQLFEGIFEVQT